MRKRTDAGFTLAETLIAMALTAIVISAAIETFNRAIGLVGTSRRVVGDRRDAAGGHEPDGPRLHSDRSGHSARRHPDSVRQRRRTRSCVPAPATLTFAANLTTLPAISPGGALGPAVIGVATDIVTLFYADQTLNLSQFPLAAIAATARR